MKFIIAQSDNYFGQPIGGKAKALAQLAHNNLNIPAWFVVLPAALHASLTAAQREALENTPDEKALRQGLENIVPSEAVQRELAQALRALCANSEEVAVRSSATDEDGLAHSFAGQLESFLFVAPEDVAARVADVWRSGFSERVLAYRRENGLSSVPQPPAVLIQRMVKAEVAGVAFAADPITGRRNITVVSAVQGVGAALVAGECDADTYHVNRANEIIERNLIAATPVLRDEQIRQVAELARATSQYFQRPQDIEWAIADGELYLLQSRSITTLDNVADPDGGLNLWDNSNIAESYGGVTTPLTFSFARRAYEEVYRQFCRVLRVPAATIQQHDQTFKHMLGLIRGRVYYNLLNWYRVLSLLPGFRLNRRFMEQMMGVKEALPAHLEAELAAAGKGEKLRDGLNLLVTLSGLIVSHWRLPKTIRAFYQRLDEALRDTMPKLTAMRADELTAYYRHLEAKLLTRWDAPLINDFFAMIYYGLLRRLVEKWCGSDNTNLYNDLLCGEGGIISAEPAKQIRAMAASIKDNPALIDVLCTGSLVEINQYLNQFSVLSSHSISASPIPKSQISNLKLSIANYLERFGDRCLDELKLESLTLHDDPLLLMRSIGRLAQRLNNSTNDATPQDSALRVAAEHKVKDLLAGHPLRRVIFNWVLRQARARVRERENLRFERTRLFGRVRRIFIELGQRFYADNLLDDARDVFYLEVEEVLGFVTGTTTTTNLKSLVTVRKAEFAGHAQAPVPAERFETRGAVQQGNQFRAIKTGIISTFGDTRQGLACCPGIVRGKVRVVTDPRNAQLQAGEILVAERTDPGWIMLFPAAAALLVERGSLLSHSAIVAREMGIPAIVAIPGVTTWLTDGDEVEMDGSTGTIRKTATNCTNGHELDLAHQEAIRISAKVGS